ncbi:hypothetical protein AB0L82_35270 [Nocardia sp. NPDC052001]|uniref:hypothetical protein n=1 Tax=Nocardia sp. NPDC052001 TaxID=3154853 RepID=UPI003446C5CF
MVLSTLPSPSLLVRSRGCATGVAGAGPRHGSLVTEVARLRETLAEREHQILTLTRELDDLLDRESMRALDPGLEALTTGAVLERYGLPRAVHVSCNVQDATNPHGRRAENNTEHVGQPALSWSVCPLTWHVLVTRLARLSRARGRRRVRTSGETSAPGVRTATRLSPHQTRALVTRAFGLVVADLRAGLRIWLITSTAPIVAWVTAQCAVPPKHPRPRVGGAR